MVCKSFFAASFLCVVASVAIAAPTLTITGGRKSTFPTRVWNVAATPDVSLLNPAGLALELGFEAMGGNILAVTVAPNMAAASAPAPARVEFDNNPGNPIFGWETLTDVDPGPDVNMQAVGIQLGTGTHANEAIAFIGTNLFSTAAAEDLITVVTEQSVTALAWGGRYNADGSMAALTGDLPGFGRIVQGNGRPSGGTSYEADSYAGSRMSNTGPQFLGDMNGDGRANNFDVVPFGQALASLSAIDYRNSRPNLNILRGDINTSGTINNFDVVPFGQVINGGFGGAGSGAGSAVPEPGCIALVGLALACFTNIRRSKNC
jgi:hypothetical protein